MSVQTGKAILGTFTPDTYALASFSIMERLLVLLEQKGVITAKEHTALYQGAAKDFSASQNLGTKPEINLAVAQLLKIMAKG